MKIMKKAMSLLLSLVMVLAFCVTAFATEAGTPAVTPTTLSIKTTAGHTYTIYQLLSGDVSNLNEGEGTLSNIKVGTSVSDKTATAEGISEALSKLSDGALGNAAYEYVKGGTAVATVGGDGTEISTSLAPGYYVVTDSYTSGTGTDSLSRYMVAVAGPTVMTPKTQTTDIDKNIINEKDTKNGALDYNDEKSGGKTDTAAIGDIIEYEVTGKVPNYEGYDYYYYVLNDKLSEGLTLKEDSFAVTVGSAPLTKDTDYYVTVTKNDDGTTSFVLSFENIKNYTTDAAISVKYNAEVNEKAVIGTDPNTNEVYLQYSNNPNNSGRGDNGDKGVPGKDQPTGTSETYKTKTYVTEINLTKVDQDGMPLKGAEFELIGENLTKVIIRTDYTFAEDAKDGIYYKLKDGTYTTTKPHGDITDEQGNVITKSNEEYYENTTTTYSRTTTVSTTTTSATDSKVTAAVNDNGFVTFTGLNAGEYTLHESKTPEGYNTVADIKFTISAAETGHEDAELVGGGISWTSDNGQVTENGGTFYVTVENRKGDLLPSTGGIGTTIFYVVGSILVLGAAILLISRRRMSK